LSSGHYIVSLGRKNVALKNMLETKVCMNSNQIPNGVVRDVVTGFTQALFAL
jgi:hypothetical protein